MSKPLQHVQCYDAYTPLENIQRCIREGHHVLILMRGVPGSGKSFLANSLASNHGGVVYSTDDFFVQNGQYRFQPEKLEEYHRNNIIRVREAMLDGVKPIIVDNTNIYSNHMEQYTFHAVNNYYEIFVLEPETWWKYEAYECFLRNTHGLEMGKIEFMLQSLAEQGNPPLSRLVGKGRQVRIEPPCLERADDDDKGVSMDHSQLSLQVPNHGRTMSLVVSSDPYPPGLLGQKSASAPASPSPTGTLASLLSPISLAFDPRSHLHSLTVRDMSTQTNEVVVTLTCAGISCTVDDVVEGAVQEVERLKERKLAMKDRVVKMENIPQVSELDVLIAIFPCEEIVNLSHYYQMLGLDECVKLFVELGSYVDWTASVREGAFIEELAAAEISATRPHAPPPITNWQRLAEQEDMKDKPSATPIQMDPADAEVKEITVTLGLDMLQKMSVLFGDGVAVEQECSLRVPVWLLEQLYLVWRGDAVRESHQGDAELAAFLQEDENNSSDPGGGPFVKRKLTVAQKLQLNMLLEEFSSCDDQSVERIFEDNRYDAEATRSTLNIMLNPDVDVVETPFVTPANKVAPVTTSRRPPPPQINLPLAQEQALQYRKEAEFHAWKRAEENQKAQRYIRSGMPAVAGAFQQVAREHASREKSLLEEASRIIIKAHEHSPILDFHLLSQKEALSLLRDRLAVLDRPETKRYGRSDRRLHVITGYGKSSGGRAVIKRAVESYLRNKGYSYSFANMGEIVIQCK
ncbi:hypothetical protein V3C99_001802 [Haemonchus contortus]